MLIKTAELETQTLDWAVCAIVQPEWQKHGVEDWREQRRSVCRHGEYIMRWSQSATQADDLHRWIPVVLMPVRTERNTWEWQATTTRPTVDHTSKVVTFSLDCFLRGETATEALCRAFVQHFRGDSVEIPDELLTS